MEEYDELVISYFLEHQDQLFPEPVAENEEEAAEFLTDCVAAVAENIAEAREILDEMGMDVTGLSDEELSEEAEIFSLPDGRYLIVEG